MKCLLPYGTGLLPIFIGSLGNFEWVSIILWGSCMIVGRSLIELKIAVHAYEPLSSGHVSDFS